MSEYKHSQFNAGWWSCFCSMAQSNQRLAGMSAYLIDVMRSAGITHEEAEYALELIDKISGKGTWDSNPYVFVYDFELIR